MKRAAFVLERRPAWRRFESLAAQAERAPGRLTGEDVAAFSQLFRGVCHDLATIRSRGWGRDLEAYVNDLVVRGHARLYRAAAPRGLGLIEFLLRGFPRLVRSHAGYFWTALALFGLPALVSSVLVARDASLAVFVLPGTTLDELEEMYSQSMSGPAAPLGMAGFYVWNNAGLAFRCFATGFFCGAGSVFYLVYNGIFLGTVTGYLLARGHGERFFGFVVGHAAFELTAIVVAGAAGLFIGHALVRPAPYTWGESLRRRGLVGTQLALGSAAMLVAAAAIEAGWSPLPLPLEVKYAAAAFFALVTAGYLTLAGRGAVDRAA